MKKYTELIEYLVKCIVDEINPLRILIFGSVARDEAEINSDIDILVVMPEGIHRRRTAQLLYRKIRGVKIPFDILVAASSDLERHKSNNGLIYQTILHE